MILRIVLLLLFVANFTFGANILAIYSSGFRSHHILGGQLFKELARRGHNITMASPFPLQTPFPNYTDVHLTGIVEDLQARDDLFLKEHEPNALTAANNYLEIINSQTELTLKHTEMKKLLSSGTNFDLIIVDWLLNFSVLFYGKLFQAPVIVIASHGTTHLSNYLVGFATPPSYVPNILLDFMPEMTLLQRSINAFVQITFNVLTYNLYKSQEASLKKIYENVPPMEEIMDNVAIILSNGHYSFESPRPIVPNIIPVGGLHIEKVKKLPEDVQNFLDGAEQGAIYFSLGTNVKSRLVSATKRQRILKVFSALPYRIMWKFDVNLENTPENVLIRDWFPQNDVLGHPNIKLFMTHGGLLSSIEAIYHAVPIVGIPIFADQKGNIANAVAAGYAVRLELSDLNEFTLSQALNEIVRNSKYRENVKKLSKIFHDQPITPIETAIFWTEHVIRHKGAPHLRNAGRHLPWYKYNMYDVALLTLIFLIVILWIVLFVVRTVIDSVTKRVFVKHKTL